MASQYYGTTALSSQSNPPILMWSPVGVGHNTPNAGMKVWTYQSTNSTTEITTAGFFTDGQSLGMAIGDILIGTYCTSAGEASYPYMGNVTAASSTGCTIGTATT